MITEKEAADMFGPIGNYEDYWLGCPGAIPASRPGTWVSAELFLTAMRQEEFDEPERDAIEALMGAGGERGGGLMGATAELSAVRAGVTAIGQASLDEEKRRSRLRERRSQS